MPTMPNARAPATLRGRSSTNTTSQAWAPIAPTSAETARAVGTESAPAATAAACRAVWPYPLW